MSKIIIVEDEKPAARRLERLLSALQYEVLKKLHSVEEAIDWFQKQPKADLIFLDIQLSDGLSFEIFEKVNIEADLIFTTAYDEYALKAFKLNSIDYLLKPIDPIELKSALKKYEKRKSSQSIDAELLKSLLIQPKNEPTYKTRFSVKVGDKLKPIQQMKFLALKVQTKQHLWLLWKENTTSSMNLSTNWNLSSHPKIFSE